MRIQASHDIERSTSYTAPPSAEGLLPSALVLRLNADQPRSVEQFAPEDIARYSFATLVDYSTSRFLKIMQPYHMNNFDLSIIGQDVSLTNQQRLALSLERIATAPKESGKRQNNVKQSVGAKKNAAENHRKSWKQ
jgi:hypothetical protein